MTDLVLPAALRDVEPVRKLEIPARLEYEFTAGAATSRFLTGITQKRILGGLVGYYSVEAGALNTLVHMWAYEDMNDRERRRALLFNDPDFKQYLAKTAGLVEKQENRILKPAPFFEQSLKAMLAAVQ